MGGGTFDIRKYCILLIRKFMSMHSIKVFVMIKEALCGLFQERKIEEVRKNKMTMSGCSMEGSVSC